MPYFREHVYNYQQYVLLSTSKHNRKRLIEKNFRKFQIDRQIFLFPGAKQQAYKILEQVWQSCLECNVWRVNLHK